MKKTYRWLPVMALLAALCFTGSAHALESLTEGDGEALTEAVGKEPAEPFVVDDKTGTLMDYTGDEADVVIPEQVGDITVRAIGYSAFERARTSGDDSAGLPAFSLRSVELPETVMFIADGAFSDCKELETFVCRASLAATGRNAFKGCTALKEVRYEGGVKRIGRGCFEDTDSLETVDFGEEPETMEENAFCRSGIRSLVLNVRYLARSAVNECANLEEVHITDRTESIASGAVSSCGALSVICYETNDLSFLPGEGVFSEPADEVTIYVPAVVPEDNLDAVKRSVIWSPRQIRVTVEPGGCTRKKN